MRGINKSRISAGYRSSKNGLRKNLVGLSVAAISEARIITTIMIADRTAIVKRGQALCRFGKALANLAKKLGPLLAPLLNIIAQAISWGAKGLAWLASNLCVLAIAVTWFAYTII